MDNIPLHDETNYFRRVFGAAILLSPCVLLALSLNNSFAHNPQIHKNYELSTGYVFLIFALLVALFNFYLSFVRYLLAKDKVNYRLTSGIPILGVILGVIGCSFTFGDMRSISLGVLALSLDTGGTLWFLISTWKDSSFWDM